MLQHIVHVSLVVRDYDEAIAFFTEQLNFRVWEDVYQPQQNKRWVRVGPASSSGPSLVLAQAKNEDEAAVIGKQAAGRVFLFLETDDFWRDFHSMRARGVNFVRQPITVSYGTVAVFEDLYGNLWDLIQPGPGEPQPR